MASLWHNCRCQCVHRVLWWNILVYHRYVRVCVSYWTCASCACKCVHAQTCVSVGVLPSCVCIGVCACGFLCVVHVCVGVYSSFRFALEVIIFTQPVACPVHSVINTLLRPDCFEFKAFMIPWLDDKTIFASPIEHQRHFYDDIKIHALLCDVKRCFQQTFTRQGVHLHSLHNRFLFAVLWLCWLCAFFYRRDISFSLHAVPDRIIFYHWRSVWKEWYNESLHSWLEQQLWFSGSQRWHVFWFVPASAELDQASKAQAFSSHSLLFLQ